MSGFQQCMMDDRVAISLCDGGMMLIGPRRAFLDSATGAENHEPHRTLRLIENIRTDAVNGIAAFRRVLVSLTGAPLTRYSRRNTVQLVRRAVEQGRLIALILPPLLPTERVADSSALDIAPSDMPEGTALAALTITPETRFADLPSMGDKLKYVLVNVPEHFSSARVIESFKNAMTATAIISAVTVLAMWAASHFVAGVGFAIDAVLIAIGWAMIGWSVFGLIRGMVSLFKDIHGASNLADLDRASKKLADIITDFGVEVLIGLLTRGAGKIKREVRARQDAGGANSQRRTSSADDSGNARKADDTEPPVRTASPPGWKNGWTPDKVMAIPKGERPDPSEYLTDKYIKDHLTQFDDGAIRFVNKDMYAEHGTLGPPGGTFALPANKYNRLMEETGGDLRQIEEKLGLDPNYLNEETTFGAYISKEDFVDLRMPSGNELGTWDEYWRPGGFTSGGTPEATIDTPKGVEFSVIFGSL